MGTCLRIDFYLFKTHLNEIRDLVTLYYFKYMIIRNFILYLLNNSLIK